MKRREGESRRQICWWYARYGHGPARRDQRRSPSSSQQNPNQTHKAKHELSTRQGKENILPKRYGWRGTTAERPPSVGQDSPAAHGRWLDSWVRQSSGRSGARRRRSNWNGPSATTGRWTRSGHSGTRWRIPREWWPSTISTKGHKHFSQGTQWESGMTILTRIRWRTSSTAAIAPRTTTMLLFVWPAIRLRSGRWIRVPVFSIRLLMQWPERPMRWEWNG